MNNYGDHTMSNEVLDIIIAFINAIKSKEKAIISIENGTVHKLCNPKYLLGQIIRQYVIPPEQYYISLDAKSLWESLSNQSIWDYYYRKYVKCENESPVTICEYTGNSNKPRAERKVSKGDGFVFRDVFHDEHMIPVAVIIDELLKLESPDYSNVSLILGNIRICRMLKCEDKKLPSKWKRPYSIEAITEMYASSGIQLIKRHN